LLKPELTKLKKIKWIFFHPKMGVAFFIALTLSSVPPILLFGTWLGQKQSDEASLRFDREAKIRARSVEEAVRELITLKREVLDVIAGTLSVLEDWHIPKLQKITDAQIKSSGSFDAFYVGNLEGTSLVIAPSVRADGTVTRAGVSYRDRDYFQELMNTKNIVFGTMKLGRQSKVANIHVAVPIYQDLSLKDKGPLRGYIGAGIKPKLIEQVVSRILKGRAPSRAVLVEQDGRVISDSDKQIPIFTLLSNRSIYGQKCMRKEGQLGVDLNGVPIRAVCRIISLKSLRWTLWMSAPQEVINEEARRSISFTIQISLFLLIAVLIVAGTLSYWVVTLMKLITENAQKVSMGLFEISLPKTRWFTPRELIEVGQITLQTISRLRESDRQVRDLVKTLEKTNQKQAPLAEAWRQISEAIEILGAEGETLFVNPAFYELLSSVPLQKHLLLKQSQLFTLFPPTTNPRSIGDVILSHAQVGLSWSSEVEITHDRKRRIHEVHSSPVFDEYGQLSRIVVIRRDVTEERIAQASAAHNDRLAAIGTLAAGMAHEINNPLTYIKMSLDLIQEGLKETTEQKDGRLLDQEIYEELNDATHDASEGVDRVSHIVQSLLSIARSGGSRGSNEAMSMVSLIEVVQACASLVKPEFSRSVQLEIEVDHTLSVMGRRSELIQVLLNLLINAAQAMPKNRLSGHWIKVASSMMKSGDIQLIVSDNAQGIPTEDLDHIFEPFFSSKPVGEGSGLGLAVSHGIIEAHQATISVSSVEGEGTTFTITFSGIQSFTDSEDISKNILVNLSGQETKLLEEPVLVREADVEENEVFVSSIPTTKRRILVVDDDVLVAKSFAKMLRQDLVVTSSSGAQALQILATSRFDLILSDVMMPNMDGPTFYQEVTIRFPRYQERFIFITGAAKNSEIAQAIRETERLILSKPITKQQLLNAVNKVLATVV
jgi:signal transduction histidine kinase